MKFTIKLKENLNESTFANEAGVEKFWKDKFEDSLNLFKKGYSEFEDILLKYKIKNIRSGTFKTQNDGAIYTINTKLDFKENNYEIYEKLYKELEKCKNSSIYGGYGYRCDLSLNGDASFIFSGFSNFGKV